jgi:hypothetical protein
MIPQWLHWVAFFSLLSGIVSSAWIIFDELRYPQPMWIMNFVWPICALFGTLAVLWAYFEFGRARFSKNMRSGGGSLPHSAITKAALHCGAGCTLGDIIAETLAMSFPTILVWLGWKSLFPEKIIASWVLDYIFAFGLGIAFQYFTIKPMRQLSAKEGLAQALKADALSLTAWQIGMYGLMAIAQFDLFDPVFGMRLQANMAEFWFVMQFAMMAGFATSYPVNWWLLKVGIKEQM